MLQSGPGDQDCPGQTLLGKSSPSPCCPSSWPLSWSFSSGSLSFLNLGLDFFLQQSSKDNLDLRAKTFPDESVYICRKLAVHLNYEETHGWQWFRIDSHLLWKCVCQSFPTDIIFYKWFRTFRASGIKLVCNAAGWLGSDILKLISTQAAAISKPRTPRTIACLAAKKSLLLHKTQPISETSRDLCNPLWANLAFLWIQSMSFLVPEIPSLNFQYFCIFPQNLRFPVLLAKVLRLPM